LRERATKVKNLSDTFQIFSFFFDDLLRFLTDQTGKIFINTHLSMHQNVRTRGYPRCDGKTHHFVTSHHLYINGERRIPIDILVEIEKIGEGRLISPVIRDGFSYGIVVCHLPEHAILETV
jgi:hypothetical protein